MTETSSGGRAMGVKMVFQYDHRKMIKMMWKNIKYKTGGFEDLYACCEILFDSFSKM